MRGDTTGDSMGVAIAGAGDVNGDGFDDIVVGAHRTDPGGVTEAGSAMVYSGSDGSLLHRFDGTQAFGFFGHNVAGAGDVNDDGFDDVIIGARFEDIGGTPDVGAAYVYSGLDGSLLHRFEGSVTFNTGSTFGAIASAGDQNGDGHDDLLIGAGLGFLAGEAFVYSGDDGSLLRYLDGNLWSGWNFGSAVANAGDVDGDGIDDLFIGDHNYVTVNFDQIGSASVFSGATGALIHQFFGFAPDDRFGWSIDGGGDVNGDGVSDLVIGAMWVDDGAVDTVGAAYVYSGADAALLFSYLGEFRLGQLGQSVAMIGDVNLDGHADFAIGADIAAPNGIKAAGTVDLYSGFDGSLIQRFEGTETNGQFGFSVAAAGDVNQDGRADLAIGEIQAVTGGLGQTGAAHAYALDPFLRSSSDQLSASSGVDLVLDLDFPASEAGFTGAVLVSAAGPGSTLVGGTEIPLTRDSYFNLGLGGWTPPIMTGSPTTLDADGNAQVTLISVPQLLPFAGTYWLAAVSADLPTSSVRLSSVALVITVVP